LAGVLEAKTTLKFDAEISLRGQGITPEKSP
jgi:hypothetical protein